MRTFITWGLIILMLCTIGWLAKSSFEKIQQRKEIEQKSSTLPDLKLYTLDSLAFDAFPMSDKSVVLIHFNTTCEHCHYEVLAIKDAADEFNDAEVIFFSTEALSLIRPFASASGLGEHTNIHFTKISFTDVTNIVGVLSVPHIFIYGPDKKLRKEFKGETRPEAILKYLR